MKSLVMLLFIIELIEPRESDVHFNHVDFLCNHQLDQGISNSLRRVRRDDETDDETQAEEAKNSKIKPASIAIELPPEYNSFNIPIFNSNPLSVRVQLNITKVLDWDELKESVELGVKYKMVWIDHRLIRNNTNAGNNTTPYDDLSYEERKARRRSFDNAEILANIWKPILFIEQLVEVKQPSIVSKPIGVRYIGELGRFEYVSSMQIRLDCSMDFKYYPADTQSCLVVIRPVSYAKTAMNLEWNKNGVAFYDLELSNYRARVDEIANVELVRGNEIYDSIQFKIIARRKLSYHLTQTYMASSFYIIITTLCFLLPSTMVEARIGISMTTLLTLTAMFGAVRESTPMVSYTKAIDIWMIGCIFFVFLTLVQFTFHICMQIRLDCSMDFKYYPADTQSCLVVIRPVSYAKTAMNLEWNKNGVAFYDLELSNYRARVDEIANVELVRGNEIYDSIQFKIIARRKLSYHLTQTYMASSFYIIITTLCFLLPSTMVEARIGISMTTLLTLTAMFGAVRESTPMVSYTKAIDIWMIGCIFFVFLTLVQFTFHIWLKHVKKYKPKVENGNFKGIKNVAYEMDNASKIQNSESIEEIDLPEMEPAFSPATIRMFERVSQFLERYSFALFLAIFFVFTAIYWIWLFTAANYFNWIINPTWNKA